MVKFYNVMHHCQWSQKCVVAYLGSPSPDKLMSSLSKADSEMTCEQSHLTLTAEMSDAPVDPREHTI